jgi:hypothetical protein
MDNNSITIIDISYVLAEKSKLGKADKIKALLNKYGAEKLIEVKPEDYAAVFVEAKKL